MQNNITQTSVGSKTSTDTKSSRLDGRENKHSSKYRGEISSINYSRGFHSDVESFHNDVLKNPLNSPKEKKSHISTGLEISQINDTKSFFDKNIPNMNNFENLSNNQFSGFSLKMAS